MTELSRRKTLSVRHMQYLMLISILQYMFTVHVNIFDIFSFNKKQEPAAVVFIKRLEEKQEEPSIDELFANQIAQAESLYNPIIYKAANEHDVELAIIRAIIMAESRYNNSSVSRRGAKGLMQLMPRTAKYLGVKDILDPEENIHAGVRYFKSLLDRFDGNVKMALAAYNAGATNVRRHNGVPPFRETQKYIKKVLAYQHFYKHGLLTETEISIPYQEVTKSL